MVGGDLSVTDRGYVEDRFYSGAFGLSRPKPTIGGMMRSGRST